MKTLRERLRTALDGPPKKTQVALAKACGISAPSVNDWLSGKTQSIEGQNLLKASAFLKVSPVWLATGRGDKPFANSAHVADTPSDPFSIPHLSTKGSMGQGEVMGEAEEVIDRITLKADWLRTNLPGCRIADLAVISGRGNSMLPTFNDGDLLLVDCGAKRVDVDGVYALSAHGRLFIKSVRQRLDGSFEISSDNPSVKTVDVLDGGHEVTIHGRVVWAWNGRKL